MPNVKYILHKFIFNFNMMLSHYTLFYLTLKISFPLFYLTLEISFPLFISLI